MKKFALSVLALLFAAVMAYSGYRAWDAYGDYRDEAAMHGAVMAFKPADDMLNQSVIDLQAQYPDAAGWLTVPGTNIDYPFVWYKDNDYYLRRDLNGEHAMAGTLFLDCRSEKDFTSQGTIIYGHNMKNGSMFGTLKRFGDRAFFEASTRGTVYLPRETLILEFFAYMVVQQTDEEIYSVELSESYFDYIRENAEHYREIGLEDGDRIVTLSTCSYAFDGARMVLLARVA